MPMQKPCILSKSAITEDLKYAAFLKINFHNLSIYIILTDLNKIFYKLISHE